MSLSTSLDWSRSMALEWSWYRFDPNTWQVAAPLDNIVSASITCDAETDTVVSASIEMDGAWPGEEFWVRAYLDAEQGGVREHVCVATLLCQTPTRDLTSTFGTLHIDAYSPLRELADEYAGFGWTAPQGAPALATAASVAREYGRAPVECPVGADVLNDAWVAGDSDTALTVERVIAAKAGYEVTCDPWGRNVIRPTQRVASLSPVATIGDDAVTGILLPPITDSTDIYGVPNVIEVVHSEDAYVVIGTAVNDDPDSQLSTVRRGRRVVQRVLNPEQLGPGCTQYTADLLARSMLADASAVTRTLEYDRGFDPRIGIGDCVRIEFAQHDFIAQGVVVRQDITCDTGATVHETVRVIERMWLP